MSTDDLNSLVEIDYSNLQNLLAAHNWRDGDVETQAVMLQIVGREKKGSLKVENIETFPCQDLRTIDQLWVRHSNGRFGFSVQKRLWESLGGTKEANIETWCRFGVRVGWRANHSWLSWSDLSFTSDAPMGQLPALVGAGRMEVCGLGLSVWFSALASKLTDCNIQ